VYAPYAAIGWGTRNQDEHAVDARNREKDRTDQEDQGAWREEEEERLVLEATGSMPDCERVLAQKKGVAPP